MPTGLTRHYGSQDLHFITCSCYQRRPWLGTPARRTLFLKILEQTRIAYEFVVVGYVVMPEHFHLLISEPEKGDPSEVMQVLKQRFARQVLTEVRGNACPDAGPQWAMPESMSGKSGSTTSTYGVGASMWRSCATCIAIR